MCEKVYSFVFVFCFSFHLRGYESKFLLETVDMNSPPIALGLYLLALHCLSTATTLFHGVDSTAASVCGHGGTPASLQTSSSSRRWLTQLFDSNKNKVHQSSLLLPTPSLLPLPPPLRVCVCVCVSTCGSLKLMSCLLLLSILFIEAGSLTEPVTCHFCLIQLASLSRVPCLYLQSAGIT